MIVLHRSYIRLWIVSTKLHLISITMFKIFFHDSSNFISSITLHSKEGMGRLSVIFCTVQPYQPPKYQLESGDMLLVPLLSKFQVRILIIYPVLESLGVAVFIRHAMLILFF